MAATRSGGSSRSGLTDPDSAVGLSGLASAAAGFFGNTDLRRQRPRVRRVRGLAGQPGRARPRRGDPNPAETLATRPGTYSAGGSIAAIADDFGARGVEAIEPDPEVAATVAIVGLGDGQTPRRRSPSREP